MVLVGGPQREGGTAAASSKCWRRWGSEPQSVYEGRRLTGEPRDGSWGRAGELLSAVVANVVAVPAVIGLVAVGAAAIVSRSLMDMAGYRLRRRPAGKRGSGAHQRARPTGSGR